MRTKIEEISDTCVRLTDESGVVTEYYVNGARNPYIRIATASGNDPQVCEGLSSRGATLFLSEGERLIDVIRREHERGRRKERGLFKRLGW